MAVSGSFNFDPTGTNIIEAALRKLGALAEGQSSTTAQQTTALQALTLMMKSWSAMGVPVHHLQIAYLYPDDGTEIFSLSSAANMAHCSTELGITKLTAAAAAAATALTVSTTPAIDVQGTSANSDFLGIELDDGTIDWTTISSGGGTTSLVATTGLTSAAASGNRVYFYTSRIERPEAVLNVWRIRALDQTRVPLEVDSEQDIRSMGNLTTEGEPIKYNSRKELTTNRLTIWPRFQDGKTYLELRIQKPFDDADAVTDTMAFPVTVGEALVYALAVRLAPEYKLPLEERMMLKQEAKEYFDLAWAHLTEMASINIVPFGYSNG